MAVWQCRNQPPLVFTCCCCAGKDYVDQLKLIIKTLGQPSEDDLTFISSHKARSYVSREWRWGDRPLACVHCSKGRG